MDVRELLESKREEILRVAQAHGARNVRVSAPPRESAAGGRASMRDDRARLLDISEAIEKIERYG